MRERSEDLSWRARSHVRDAVCTPSHTILPLVVVGSVGPSGQLRGDRTHDTGDQRPKRAWGEEDGGRGTRQRLYERRCVSWTDPVRFLASGPPSFKGPRFGLTGCVPDRPTRAVSARGSQRDAELAARLRRTPSVAESRDAPKLTMEKEEPHGTCGTCRTEPCGGGRLLCRGEMAR